MLRQCTATGELKLTCGTTFQNGDEDEPDVPLLCHRS